MPRFGFFSKKQPDQPLRSPKSQIITISPFPVFASHFFFRPLLHPLSPASSPSTPETSPWRFQSSLDSQLPSRRSPDLIFSNQIGLQRRRPHRKQRRRGNPAPTAAQPAAPAPSRPPPVTQQQRRSPFATAGSTTRNREEDTHNRRPSEQKKRKQKQAAERGRSKTAEKERTKKTDLKN